MRARAAGSTLLFSFAALVGCAYDFDAHFGGATEDCTNGVDDDGDGAVDCEDPDCAGAAFTCVAPAPADWNGPAIFGQTVGDHALACATPWTKKVDAPTCTACSCSGGTCGTPSSSFSDGSCSGG